MGQWEALTYKMDRILIGNTAPHTGDYPTAASGHVAKYCRENTIGVFISKPGKNVFSCNTDDLLFSTDSSVAGFLQILGTGTATLESATSETIAGTEISQQSTQEFSPSVLRIPTGIEAPHAPHSDNPVMVNWVVVAGLGKDDGSAVYDTMGGNGTNSWDGDGVDSYGLPNGYNPLHTGEWEHGGRRAFWQHPPTHPYHLSNTCVTNDPSAFNWSWWQTPITPSNLTDSANWGITTTTFDPYNESNQNVGDLLGENFNFTFSGLNDISSISGLIDLSGFSTSLESVLQDLPILPAFLPDITAGFDMPGIQMPNPIFRHASHLLRMPGDFCWAQTSIDTTSDPPQIDLYFYNGHANIKFVVGYTIYRERGAG